MTYGTVDEEELQMEDAENEVPDHELTVDDVKNLLYELRKRNIYLNGTIQITFSSECF